MEVFRLKGRPHFHITELEGDRRKSMCGSADKKSIRYSNRKMRVVMVKEGAVIKQYSSELLCQVCVAKAYINGYLEVKPKERMFHNR